MSARPLADAVNSRQKRGTECALGDKLGDFFQHTFGGGVFEAVEVAAGGGGAGVGGGVVVGEGVARFQVRAQGRAGVLVGVTEQLADVGRVRFFGLVEQADER